MLSALACSITHGYAPEMHVDTPMDGALECIVSSSPVYCSRARNCVKMLQTLALGSRREAPRSSWAPAASPRGPRGCLRPRALP